MSPSPLVLESPLQRLHLVPKLGGGIAAWDWRIGNRWSSILRPWNGVDDDRYMLACFPLVPWSNRITHGGFTQDGTYYPIDRNRNGEAYPIHGDGWLQPWHIAAQSRHGIQLALESHRHDSNPYDYVSTQSFTLQPNGLVIELVVTHLGDRPLPYGLGLHPYFVRDAATRLQMKTDGVWLSGDDPIPTSHTKQFPPSWDYNQPSLLDGPLIDNCYTGWDGKAVVTYPDRGLTITMTMADCNGYSLMYRPPGLPYFCLEPITHPIDAFHMPTRPGLIVLGKDESMTLKVAFDVSA